MCLLYRTKYNRSINSVQGNSLLYDVQTYMCIYMYVPYTGRLAIVYGIQYRRKYSLLVLIYHGPTEG